MLHAMAICYTIMSPKSHYINGINDNNPGYDRVEVSNSHENRVEGSVRTRNLEEKDSNQGSNFGKMTEIVLFNIGHSILERN